MALFYSSVPVGPYSVTVSHDIIYTCGFPSVTSQNVFPEKGLWMLRVCSLQHPMMLTMTMRQAYDKVLCLGRMVARVKRYPNSDRRTDGAIIVHYVTQDVIAVLTQDVTEHWCSTWGTIFHMCTSKANKDNLFVFLKSSLYLSTSQNNLS